MGSESTSKFEVKNPKSQKQTKKKHKSKDITKKASSNTDAENNTTHIEENDSNHIEINIKHKKQKRKKEKSNTINNTSKEVIKDNEEENNLDRIEVDHNEEELDNEVPPKKKANVHTEHNLDNAEESHQNNAKTPKQPSKRQLKKEKAKRKGNEKRMANKMEVIKKGLNYVSKWKYARSEWKFEKLRQIWLIDNLLDETTIPDDIFPTVLEYFEGCKGMAREQLLKKGMDVIRKVEENEENKDEAESIAYLRARKLLQALPTET